MARHTRARPGRSPAAMFWSMARPMSHGPASPSAEVTSTSPTTTRSRVRYTPT